MIPGAKRVLFVCFVMLIMACTSALAQSTYVSASFGSFYGISGQIPEVDATVGTPGSFMLKPGTGTFQTSVGQVVAPQSWQNVSGQSTYTIPIRFIPNGVDGKFSGSFTATYTNQNTSSGGPATLQLNINFSGDNLVPVATAGLKYEIISILYDPPGNASTSGFSNAVSAGTTTSVANNFSTSDSISFSGKFLLVSNSVTFTTTQAATNTSNYSTTYTATAGSQLQSVQQAIDHNQDQVYLLIDRVSP